MNTILTYIAAFLTVATFFIFLFEISVLMDSAIRIYFN